jgi:ISXO2-like transposase domain
VVIVRERDGNPSPQFSIRKAKLLHSFALASRSEVVHADEAAAWDNLHECFQVKRIDHQEAYSLDGACTNMAEEYFSRLRRAEIRIHRHIAAADLLRDAPESSWREDNRRVSDGDQVNLG